MKKFIGFILVILVLSAQWAVAQIPKTMSYQGVLADSSGNSVTDGNYNLTLRIYNVASGGTELWTEAQNIPIVDGVFNAILGSATPLNLNFDEPYWLGVTVESGTELSPRIELTSSAYSLGSEGGAGDGHSLDAADGEPTDVVFVDNDGNVGISNTNPAFPLSLGSSLGMTKLALFETGVNNSYGLGITAGAFRLHLNGNGARFAFFDSDESNANEVFTIRGNGQVGIGTTNPTQQLELTGNLQLPPTSTAGGDSAGIILVGGKRFTHNFGTNNFFAGENAGNLTTSGFGRNTGIGASALSSNTTGSNNTATGFAALTNNTTGNNNTANGAFVLQNNTTGNDNTANGTLALNDNTTGTGNTANGFTALNDNTTGNDNTANGSKALSSNTTGDRNTANGAGALFKNTTGTQNTANGASTLVNNTSGNENTANGAFALFKNVNGNKNTANGNSALFFNTAGNQNTATGNSALQSNTTGNENTANGAFALFRNTTGLQNTANGAYALQDNTTGSVNTANGLFALGSNTSGNNNTANGVFALHDNTTGNFNTANGYSALTNNIDGNRNTANGYSALQSNTTGNTNTANGALALENNTTGNDNTALGKDALNSNQAGSGNTAIGSGSDVSGNNLINATAIGFNAVVSSSNKIRLGNNDVTVVETAGTLRSLNPSTGLNVTGSVRIGSVEEITDGGSFSLAFNSNLIPTFDNARDLGSSSFRWDDVWATNGTIQTSDRRDKQNIREINYGLREVLRLRPVSFQWKGRPEQGKKLGLIAQDLLEVIPEVVKTSDWESDEENPTQVKEVEVKRLGVYYSNLIPVLVKAIQEQQKEIEELKSQIKDLHN